MVFGNAGEESATGVAFTRDPANGENIFYGEYLVNAQGEDVVAGIRTPLKIQEMAGSNWKKTRRELEAVRKKLEREFGTFKTLNSPSKTNVSTYCKLVTVSAPLKPTSRLLTTW